MVRLLESLRSRIEASRVRPGWNGGYSSRTLVGIITGNVITLAIIMTSSILTFKPGRGIYIHVPA